MKKKSTQLTGFIPHHLCTGCGSCTTVCPTGCISIKKTTSEYKASIDTNRCINCDACLKVCPVYSVDLKPMIPHESYPPDKLKFYVAWAKDEDVRKRCASGGIITAILTNLLNSKKIDYVTIVDFSTPGHKQISMHCTGNYTALLQSVGSHYFLVNISELLYSINKNPTARYVVIGLPCQIYSIHCFLNLKNIPKNNIVFIGLICSKSLNYRIVDYYRKTYSTSTITSIHFRDKSSHGAPGDVKITDDQNQLYFAPTSERRALSKFYKNKRCLYCNDRFNILSDISVGDCFRDEIATEKGENFLCIRTPKGFNLFTESSDLLHFKPLSENMVPPAIKSLNLYPPRGVTIGLYPNISQKPLSLKQFLHLLIDEFILSISPFLPIWIIRFVISRNKHSK